MVALSGSNERRVHCEVAEGAVIDSLQAVALWEGRTRQRGEKREGRRRCGSLTKETEIAGMDDCFCVGFACEIIEGGKTATDVCNAENAAMDGVE